MPKTRLEADSQMSRLFVKLHGVKPFKRSVRAKATTNVWLSQLHAALVGASTARRLRDLREWQI